MRGPIIVMNHLDLCSGIGGFSIAAEHIGFRTIGFSEINTFCSRVLQRHWPHVFNYGDIRNVIVCLDTIHVLTAGLPCQPYSVAGKQRGNADPRHLWPEFMRIARSFKPRNILVENVPGLVAMELDNILADLEGEAYTCGAFIIPACAANAPHRRDRLWIVAHSLRERRSSWLDIVSERFISLMQDWDVEAYKAEWSNVQSDTWTAMQAENWLSFNADASRTNDGISDRVERIRAGGNSIVPAVAYPLLKFIYELERLNDA